MHMLVQNTHSHICTEPIVPQITTGTPNNTSISADDVALRSPGSSVHHSGGSLKGPLRLFSHPVVRDDTLPLSVSPKVSENY